MPTLPTYIDDTVCCGGPPPPKSSPDSLPGYQLCSYVERFIERKGVKIPIVASTPSSADRLGSVLARIGLTRNSYTVAPGLYGVGDPDQDSPVLVTANYKLSFDTVRFSCGKHNVWLLVLDTCGINVWCAAGKGTFGTEEIVQQIKRTELDNFISHHQLIIPQLGACGVAAHEVKSRSGFRVIYGPVRASDIPAFLNDNLQVNPSMRTVSFTFTERAVLIPVELYLLKGVLWWMIPLIFILSGFNHGFFSLSEAINRGLQLLAALVTGAVSGAIVVPLILPYLPGKTFSFKGIVSGILFGAIFTYLSSFNLLETIAVILWITSVSSYMAMNFTGSTPFTSASGVEWEMKRAIPFQLTATLLAIIFWIAAPFT